MDKQQQSNEEVINGYVDHIIFRNNDNGYTVMVMICDEEELTCVGVFSDIAEGECIEAKGEYTDHPTYGRQFAVKSFEEKAPQDALAIERYLGSGAIKGMSGDSRKIRSALSRKNRSGLRKSKESARGRRWRSRIRSMKNAICVRR